MRKLKSWFRGLSMTGKVASVAVALLLFFSVMGAVAQTSSPTNSATIPGASAQAAPTAVPKPTSPKVEVKTETKTEPIAFTTSTVEDNTLAQGTSQIQTAGINGVLTHTYQVTYTNGVETSRSAPVDTVTTPPVNAVKATGTYVIPVPVSAPVSCPNGTYVNSVGNTICSPYGSSSAPADATARCIDGTYSSSQSRRGTCSHHGGVASWL